MILLVQYWNSLARKGKLILDNLSPDIIDDNIKDKVRIEKIYTLFKKDKSKKFLLSGKIILDAVRNGIKNGTFGYASELPEKNDNKYVAQIGKETNINWEGYVIKKNLIFDEVISPGSSAEVLAGPTSTVTDTELVDRVVEHDYNYRIDFNDTKEIVSILEKYPILSVSGKTNADCHIELKNDSDTITIHSKLKQSHEIKSLIQSLLNTNRYTGNGHMTITSDCDLNDDFMTYKIKAKKVEKY